MMDYQVGQSEASPMGSVDGDAVGFANIELVGLPDGLSEGNAVDGLGLFEANVVER